MSRPECDVDRANLRPHKCGDRARLALPAADLAAAIVTARWPAGLICPYCESDRVGRHKRCYRRYFTEYHCLECLATFVDTIDTPFYQTRLPLDIVAAVILHHADLRPVDLAREVGISLHAASRLARRVACCPDFNRRLRQALAGATTPHPDPERNDP
jgi:transposase-like protein